MITGIQAALVDAFTRVPGEGNRAGVVLDAGRLEAAAMQAVARAIGASETAFLVSADGAWGLRYFTPAVEVPFCGHATVAALHLLVESGRLPSPARCTVACAAGRLGAEIEAAEGGCRIWLATPLQPWAASPLDDRTALELLGGTAAMRDGSLPIERSGPRLFVPVERRSDLFALQPSWDRVAALEREHGIAGVLAFTRDAVDRQSVAHSRYFAPARGVREDPVTGAASGPLGAYLARKGVLRLPPGGGSVRARVEQGDAMGKPGRVELDVESSRGEVVGVRIGGVAATVIAGALGAVSPAFGAQGGARAP